MRRTRSVRSWLTIAALAAVALAFSALAADRAQATAVGFTLDRGVIDLNGPEGTWAKIVDPDLSPPDVAAKINTQVAGDGSLTAEASGFTFPQKRIEDLETGNPLLPVVDANIKISAEGALSGTHDEATGITTINLPALVEITVYPANSPASVAKCKVNGFTLALTTSGTITNPGDPEADPPVPAAEYEGSPFAPPPKTGSLLATWASLPASQGVSGSLASIVCPALDGMLGGPGGIWLSGTTQDGPIAVPPTDEPKLSAQPTGSTTDTTAEFKFTEGDEETQPVTGFDCSLDDAAYTDCSSGTQVYSGLSVGNHKFLVRAKNDAGASTEVASVLWRVSEDAPKPPPAKLTLSVSPASKKVKRGKTATVTAKVKNVGGKAAGGVKVCVAAPKSLVKAKKKCLTKGSLAPGATAKLAFKVTVSRKAKRGRKANLSFVATGSGVAKKTARSVIRIG